MDRIVVILPSDTAMRRDAVPGSVFGIARLIIIAVLVILIGLTFTGTDPVPEQYTSRQTKVAKINYYIDLIRGLYKCTLFLELIALAGSGLQSIFKTQTGPFALSQFVRCEAFQLGFVIT